MSEDETAKNYPEGGLAPEKFIGKDITTVTDRFKVLNLTYRVVSDHGLITADYDSSRYNLKIDENDIITECVFG